MAQAARQKPRQVRRRAAEPAREKAAPKKGGKREPASHDERQGGKDERKAQILRAAVEVFAERGYHGCRISDVADRAGVAYGLVYHYFGNKESLLAHIFSTNWSVFAKALEDVAEQETTTQDKIRQIVLFLMNAFELNPLIVKVLVLEFGRSSRLGDALDAPEVTRVFAALQRIFKEGAHKGELLPELDPRALTVVFLGALEASLASFIIPTTAGKHALGPVSFETMRDTLMAIVNRGFFPKSPTPAARKR